jgi:hypothetical protein
MTRTDLLTKLASEFNDRLVEQHIESVSRFVFAVTYPLSHISINLVVKQTSRNYAQIPHIIHRFANLIQSRITNNPSK